jgi:hypothetical protein
MLCQLELLAHLFKNPSTPLRFGEAALRRCAPPSGLIRRNRKIPRNPQTLHSLWTVWARQAGQNFLIANLSVCFFLFLVVV